MATKRILKAQTPTMEQLFTALGSKAQELNEVSDELLPVITGFNERFKTLNLGISFWHTWAKTETGGNAVGYSRVGSHWGLSVRRFKDVPEYSEETWLMQDAPRWMRIEALGQIDMLLVAGIRAAEQMASKIVRAKVQAQELLKSISPDNTLSGGESGGGQDKNN